MTGTTASPWGAAWPILFLSFYSSTWRRNSWHVYATKPNVYSKLATPSVDYLNWAVCVYGTRYRCRIPSLAPGQSAAR